MARKGRLGGKFAHAAHIKRHTKGTSNEISFSVLDAAKMMLDGDDEPLPHGGLLGRIPLFTLPGRRGKKVSATPAKGQEFVLPGGEPLQGDPVSSVPQTLAPPAGVSPLAKGAQEPPSFGAKLGRFSQKRAKTQGEMPSVSREKEIALRKARRKLYRVTAVSFVALTTVGLLTAAGAFLYGNHQEQVSYANELRAVLEEISDIDEIVVEMDSALANPTDHASLEAMPQLLEEVADARSRLEQAQEKNSLAFEGLRESTVEREAAGNATVAIGSRLEMLSQGEALMLAALGLEAASNELAEAWQMVLDADSLTREAAQLVSSYTVSNIEASQVKTQEALTLFEQAAAQIEAVAANCPGIEVSSQQQYLQKRLEAQQHALASGNAMLLEDATTAVTENEACNAAEGEAATLAESLPDNPADPATERYAMVVKEPAKAYEEARSQAAAADAFLRDYLGSFTK